MAKYSSRRTFKKRDARDLLGRRVTGVARADRTAIAVELDGDILLAPATLVPSDGSSTEPILVDGPARAVLINDRDPDEAEVFTLDVDGSYRDRTPGADDDDPRIDPATGEPDPEYFDKICSDCKAQWNSLLWRGRGCPACQAYRAAAQAMSSPASRRSK